jgi:putative restriction endonuclease
MENSLWLLQLLISQLKEKIFELSVHETEKWYSFYQKGDRKFAYCLLAKKTPKISFWCLGDFDEIKNKYDGKIKFLPRTKTQGEFGKNFQISFMIENTDDIIFAVMLLSEVSNSWSKEELLSAYNLYCKIQIDKIIYQNTDIIRVAELLNKTPKEIVKRFKNFSKLDSAVKTLENIEQTDINTWNSFNTNWEKSVYDSESKIVDFEYKLGNLTKFPKGKDRKYLVKSRVNQNFFRMAVLSSYQNRCCITGLSLVELLNASHIIPWVVDESNRLNPRNGLCLNALHDRAFDKGFLTVTTDYMIHISHYISNILDSDSVHNYFLCYENQKIILPNRFLPKKIFLEYHNKKVFKK